MNAGQRNKWLEKNKEKAKTTAYWEAIGISLGFISLAIMSALVALSFSF